MESENNTFKIPKLRNDNFHSWKYRVELVLSIRDIIQYIQDDPPLPDSDEYRTWAKGDVKARATIGITLNDEHMEQVLHCKSARDMWQTLCDIFEKHTLLNKLAARRNFYTATMTSVENVSSFSSRIRQLAGTLRSMGVILEESEMAMALLNGLPERFDGLISALDALGNDDKIFTLEFVKSRCVQEEQRHSQRDKLSLSKSETTALVANRSSTNETCIHCGKHKDNNRCYTKYPHLAPPGHPRRKKERALFGQASRQKKSCTKHFTHDRAAFVSYESSTPTLLDLGASSTAQIVGKGSISLELIVKGKRVKCKINDVNHVPGLRYQLLSVSTMAKLGIETKFNASRATLTQKSNRKLLATGSMVNGPYTLDTLLTSTYVDTALVASLNLWHQRFWSFGSNRYIITFIDDYSSWTVQYTMQNKSEYLKWFKTYKAYAETRTNRILRKLAIHEFRGPSRDSGDVIGLKALRSDNVGEYLSHVFKR
eukprot:IDg924t1